MPRLTSMEVGTMNWKWKVLIGLAIVLVLGSGVYAYGRATQWAGVQMVGKWMGLGREPTREEYIGDLLVSAVGMGQATGVLYQAGWYTMYMPSMVENEAMCKDVHLSVIMVRAGARQIRELEAPTEFQFVQEHAEQAAAYFEQAAELLEQMCVQQDPSLAEAAMAYLQRGNEEMRLAFTLLFENMSTQESQ